MIELVGIEFDNDAVAEALNSKCKTRCEECIPELIIAKDGGNWPVITCKYHYDKVNG